MHKLFFSFETFYFHIWYAFDMPSLTIITPDGQKTVDVPENKRLVLAVEDAGVDISHRCGGNAKCTTCRVEFIAGEPPEMNHKEKAKLQSTDALGKYRLSCQILVDRDMTVKPLKLVREQSWDDPGPRPSDTLSL